MGTFGGSHAGRRVLAYVGLGSNLDEPVAQIRRAFGELDRIPRSRCIRTSSLYISPPLGPIEQPDYVNAVALVETGLAVATLLQRLHGIEEFHGRRRNGTRWGPRPLDLDILLYGDCRMDTPRLILPHPGLHKRSFVLYPMSEVAPPGLRIPGHGSLRELIKGCGEQNITRL